MEVVEGESGDEARREELVDVVGIEVLDCGRWIVNGGSIRDAATGRDDGTARRVQSVPVTLEVENGRSMVNSSARA